MGFFRQEYWSGVPLPSPIPPLRVITEPGAELRVLYGSSPLASYFTHGGVYTSGLRSQVIPPSHPLPHVHKSVLPAALQMVIAAMKLKDAYSLEGKL